jgi:hypothetical protein
VSGATISNGTVIINGEVLPFEGGPAKDYVAVVQTTNTAPYKDGEDKPFYVTRKAVPADAGLALASMVRLATFKAHYANKSNPHEVTKTQVGLGNLPNAKSDSISLDNSDSLATSKAVYDGVRSIKGGTASVTHNLGMPAYRVFVTNAYQGVGDAYTQMLRCVVFDKTNNAFSIRVKSDYSSSVTFPVDWILIPA